MTTNKINGIQFEGMMRNGLAYFQRMEQTVNDLNVFPVADGDTGTNMCHTLANGIRSASTNANLGAYLGELSRGLLLGARGNSGVILSQFFKGVWQALSTCEEAGPLELRDALTCGYRTAYASMVEPVEGTMLTVFREGIDLIRDNIHGTMTLDDMLSLYLGEMKKSLSLTTQRLPALAEAGVVDSGAMGFVLLMEGMRKCLNGEILQADLSAPAGVETAMADTRYFHEDSTFEKGYCMEYILQLLKGEDYAQDFSLPTFIDHLRPLGDSLAVVQDETRVKVHIHTKKPAKVICLAQQYGEFVNFKLENMQLQHSEHMSRKTAAAKKHKHFATVCVANGAGAKQILEELGCDYVIDGGSTMNTSAQEFTDALSQLDADTIVILPNHKNNFAAAEQAVELFGKENIHVLPSKSVAEGYFALAMDVGDSTDDVYRISQMEQGIRNVVTLAQTRASKAYAGNPVSCEAGDEIVLNNDHLICAGSDWCEALIAAMHQVEDVDTKECCVIFCGSDVSDEQQQMLEEQLQEQFPDLEPTFMDGGQAVYRWILGLA